VALDGVVKTREELSHPRGAVQLSRPSEPNLPGNVTPEVSIGAARDSAIQPLPPCPLFNVSQGVGPPRVEATSAHPGPKKEKKQVQGVRQLLEG
jgi:hypothetical protein